MADNAILEIKNACVPNDDYLQLINFDNSYQQRCFKPNDYEHVISDNSKSAQVIGSSNVSIQVVGNGDKDVIAANNCIESIQVISDGNDYMVSAYNEYLQVISHDTANVPGKADNNCNDQIQPTNGENNCLPMVSNGKDSQNE